MTRMMRDSVKEHARQLLSTLVSKLPKGVMTDERNFNLFQSKGWHALPVDYYAPSPNTAELGDEIWSTPSSMVGVNLELERQRALLESIATRYLVEYHAISDSPPENPTQYTRGTGFSGMDGALLYAMIRKHKPRRIIEVGSGYSTLLSLHALAKNAGEDGSDPGHLTAIEPYPADFLRDALKGVGRLIEDKVERVPFAEFERLEKNDILFIDSSHAVRIGGDVVYEILEVVPRLKPGVIVHFHDIFLPLEYPKDWVKQRRVFWNEQYLLHAFMAFNTAFEVLWSAGSMHVHCSDSLAKHFPYYDSTRQQAGSFWIQRRTAESKTAR